MTLFLYIDRDSWLHRLDPRTKLAGALLFVGLCLCFNDPLYEGAIAGGLLLLACSAAALPHFRRFRFVLALLFFFSAGLWAFFAEGKSLLWSWGPLRVSRESLLFGLATGLRLVSFVATGLILLATTRNEELTNGLIRLGIPYPLAFAFSTALRLVPTFAGAGATIIQAQVSRGLDIESGSVFSRARKFLPQAVPLFFYALRQANLLAMALESKGFDPTAKRTFYYEPKMGRADWIYLGILFLALGAGLYLRLGLGLGAVIPGRL
jgi:energy-coupling factor transport system permease protein